MKNISIYIPESSRYVGGPHTFLDNLIRYLIKANFNLSNNHFRSKGIFFPIEFDKRLFLSYKNSFFYTQTAFTSSFGNAIMKVIEERIIGNV